MGGARLSNVPMPHIAGTVTEAKLAVAARHVAQGRAIVARQRERIARLKAKGACTASYERTLELFVATLEILEEHEHTLIAPPSR